MPEHVPRWRVATSQHDIAAEAAASPKVLSHALPIRSLPALYCLQFFSPACHDEGANASMGMLSQPCGCFVFPA